MASLLDLSREEHTIDETPIGEPQDINPEEPENVAGDGKVQNGPEEKSDESSTGVEGAEDALIGDALKTIASLEAVNRTLSMFVKHKVKIDQESLVRAYSDISKAYADNNLKEPVPLVMAVESHQTLADRTHMVQELICSVESQISGLLKNVQMIQDNRINRIKARVASISRESLEVSQEVNMNLAKVAVANKAGGGTISQLWNNLTMKQSVYLPFEAKDVSFFKSIKVGDEKTLVETLRRNINNLRTGRQLELFPLDFRSWKNGFTNQIKNTVGQGQGVNIDIPMTDKELWMGFCKQIKEILDKNPDKSSFLSRLLFIDTRHNHAEVTEQKEFNERFVGILEALYNRAVEEFSLGVSFLSK